MGVKTPLSLQEAQELFEGIKIDSLKPTKNGLVDTTYLSKRYVIKKFEKLNGNLQKNLHDQISASGLNVPKHLRSNDGWHLFTRLEGKQITYARYYHIVALARFFKKLHSLRISYSKSFYDATVIEKELRFAKRNFFYYYKKVQPLQSYRPQNECFIHGDLFLDNAVFDGSKIGVFDFGDSGYGQRTFDVGVALVAFGMERKRGVIKLFLQVYNQTNGKKLTQKALQEGMRYAKLYYALRRVAYYKSTKKAKQLL